MLSEFLIWWSGQLRSLLPGRLRGGGVRRGAMRLLLEPGLSGVRAVGRGGAGASEAFALDAEGLASLRAGLGGRAVELELPPGRMLSRTVSLPLAAERDPGQVLRYEMDRLTPFGAEAVHWSWRRLGRVWCRRTVCCPGLLIPRSWCSQPC